MSLLSKNYTDNQRTLFDANMTKVLTVDGKQMVKIITWYDNEMSYTAQMVRTIQFLAENLKD